MDFELNQIDINKIAETLGVEINSSDQGWSWKMANTNSGQSLLCTIYSAANLDKNNTGILVSVQTQHGYFELHDCNNYMIFEPDEVIFIEAKNDKVSSLIIGKNCSCSMYANISRDNLGADFSELDPAVLLSAMQLSLTESILPANEL